jgi:hypothetical protein
MEDMLRIAITLLPELVVVVNTIFASTCKIEDKDDK